MKCIVALGIFAFAIVLTDAYDPVGVAFKGDNDKYLSRIYDPSNEENYIEVTKDNKDQYTRFIATEDNGKLLLKADNEKYLCRVESSDGFDYIQPAMVSPDQSCQFTVHNQPDGTVVLQADNGKYNSRVTWKGINYYMAYKDQIDVYCKLKLEFQLEAA